MRGSSTCLWFQRGAAFFDLGAPYDVDDDDDDDDDDIIITLIIIIIIIIIILIFRAPEFTSLKLPATWLLLFLGSNPHSIPILLENLVFHLHHPNKSLIQISQVCLKIWYS